MKIIEIEDAILTALTALKTAGTINAVEVLNDPEADIKSLVTRLGTRAPFVIAAYAGGALVPMNVAAGKYRHAPEYVILVGVKRVRPTSTTARDALHPIVADVMAALSGKNLSLDIKPIKFIGRISLVSWGRPLMVFGLTITTEFLWDISTEAS